MTLLRIDASILGPMSASSELADIVLASWTEQRPDDAVVIRHLAHDPLSSEAWALAVGAGYTPENERSDAQKSAVDLAKTLRAEISSADQIVLAAPFYNFGVSQHIKIWIDLILAGGDPGERILEGKPVVIVTTRGGNYSAGTPREGWDHNTDYLRRIFADVWGADLTLIEREFTLVGVNPALDQFTELGATLKKDAHAAASDAGKALAAR